MPFVRHAHEAHRSANDFRERRPAMLRVIDHLIERIEALIFRDRRAWQNGPAQR
jgi:hypothetical protein